MDSMRIYVIDLSQSVAEKEYIGRWYTLPIQDENFPTEYRIMDWENVPFPIYDEDTVEDLNYRYYKAMELYERFNVGVLPLMKEVPSFDKLYDVLIG